MQRYICPITLAAALLTIACGPEQAPTGPSLARGAVGAQFSAAPTVVGFTYPPGGSEVITVTAQYVTTVTSSTSNTGCATVSPTSVPTGKVKGSSYYIATFTVTATGAGNCTITLGDKNGRTVTVQVTVALPDRIVYSSYANGSRDVYIMDLDGGNRTPLTTTTDQDEWGILSPDGRSILFVWSKQVAGEWVDGYNIMGVDGSGVTPIGVSGEISDPAFSPTSQQLVFSRSVDLKRHLFKADLSGANEVQLTFPGTAVAGEYGASWAGGSPGRIAFFRDGLIWIMNPDGSGQAPVVSSEDIWDRTALSATLSPDGTRIAFTCQPEHHEEEICVVKLDGTGVTRLTDAAGPDRFPRWTRDGRIIFTTVRDGNEEVYIMNADGTDQTNLTNTDSEHESTIHP